MAVVRMRFFNSGDVASCSSCSLLCFSLAFSFSLLTQKSDFCKMPEKQLKPRLAAVLPVTPVLQNGAPQLRQLPAVGLGVLF